MRMVIVEFWNLKKEKRVKRYTEWFYDASVEFSTDADKKSHAVREVVRKYGRLFPGCVAKLHNGNQ